jgi:hypothetical protein
MNATQVSEEVATGDRRRALVALRARLAAELDDGDHLSGCDCECGVSGADGRVVAAVVKELRAVISELDSLPGGEEVRPVDDLATRRAQRLADAAGQ